MGIFVCHRRSLLNLGSCRRTTVREGSAVSLWHWLKESTVNPAGGSSVGAGWVGVGTQIEAWGGLQLRAGNEEVGESGLDPCWRSWWGGKGEPGSLGSSRAFCPFLPFCPLSIWCLSLLSSNIPSVPALSLPTASPSFFPLSPSLSLHLSPQFPMDPFLLPGPILCPPGSIPFFSFSSTLCSTTYNWKSKTLLVLGLLIESGLCCLLLL